MVRSARFSWSDEDHFETPDRSNGLDDLDDFDGFETARRKRKNSRERRVESGEPELTSRHPTSDL